MIAGLLFCIFVIVMYWCGWVCSRILCGPIVRFNDKRVEVREDADGERYLYIAGLKLNVDI